MISSRLAACIQADQWHSMDIWALVEIWQASESSLSKSRPSTFGSGVLIISLIMEISIDDEAVLCHSVHKWWVLTKLLCMVIWMVRQPLLLLADALLPTMIYSQNHFNRYDCKNIIYRPMTAWSSICALLYILARCPVIYMTILLISFTAPFMHSSD